MSKIKISELNNTSLEVLNNQQVSEVVGGNGRNFNNNFAWISADTSVLNLQVDNGYGYYGGNSAYISAGSHVSVNQQS